MPEKTKMYHGTNKANLPFLRSGTWISELKETAKTFGSIVYTLYVDDDDVDWEYLSPEVCDWDTGEQGEWRGQLRKDYNLT